MYTNECIRYTRVLYNNIMSMCVRVNLLVNCTGSLFADKHFTPEHTAKNPVFQEPINGFVYTTYCMQRMSTKLHIYIFYVM